MPAKKPTTPAGRRKVWVKALRSGRYKQGHGALKRGKGQKARYCCLGVALRVCNLDKANRDPGLPENCQLCSKNLRLLGIDESRQRGLIHVNDGLEYSFKQIADIIEGRKRVSGN